MTDQRNVFSLDRDSFDHEMFKGKELCHWAAWAWLIGEAAWAERTVRGQGGPVKLARGQLSHSIRFMADKWKWHKSRVERFLDALEKRDMIKRQTETGQLLITICNYNEYQLGRDSNRDTIETTTETGPRQDRDRIETKNNQGIKKSKTPPPVEDAAAPLAAEDEDDIQLPPIHPAAEPAKPQRPSLRDVDPARLYQLMTGGKLPSAKPKTAAAAPRPEESDFDAFWLVYPRRPNNPRKPALQSYLRARRNGATHEAIMAGVQALAAEWRREPKERLRFCPHATTWLNDERWKDVASAEQARPADETGAMDGMWRDLVTRYRTPRKEWPMGMGPAPDQPGCKAPVHILAEFGYNVAA